jgi:hypothetical protein
MTKLAGGADLSLFVGLLLTGALYGWAARPAIRRQAARSSGKGAIEQDDTRRGE